MEDQKSPEMSFGENPQAVTQFGVNRSGEKMGPKRPFPGMHSWKQSENRFGHLTLADLQQEFEINHRALGEDLRMVPELTRKGNSALMLNRMLEVAKEISSRLCASEKREEAERSTAQMLLDQIAGLRKQEAVEELPTGTTLSDAAQDVQTSPLYLIREKLTAMEWRPQQIKKLLFIAKNLVARVEKAEQEAEILRTSGHSEKEVSRILSRMNILEKQVEVLGVERNCLNQVIRILASQGKIDPASEAPVGPPIANECGEQRGI